MDSTIDLEKRACEEITYTKAYLAWLFGGWMGAHRLYLGKWLSGALYMVSLGILFMGWGIDLLLIPRMVKSRRKKLVERWRNQAERAKELGEPQGVESLEENFQLAPWAGKSDWMAYIEFPMRLLFFLFAPALFAAFALANGSWEVVVLTVVILLSTSFISFVQRALVLNPELEKMPILSDALASFKKLHGYYMENKPRSFIFYVGYVFFGFPSMIFSAKVREEFRLYRNMVFSIFVLLVVETIMSYNSVYPPYLTWEDALTPLFAELFLIFFFFVSFMMPMVTTSFSLSLSGKQNMSRMLTFVGLGFGILLNAGLYYNGLFDSDTLADSINFQARMSKQSFRQDLGTTSEMFLKYYAAKSNIKIEQSITTKVYLDAEKTEMYRKNVEGFVAGNETKLLEVFTVERPGEHQVYGIRCNNVILFLVDHNGKFYQKWSLVPQAIQEIFEEKLIMPSGEDKYRCVRTIGLIEDLYRAKNAH